VRVPDLQRFRLAVAALCRQERPSSHPPVVVVPTSAARRVLERTLEGARPTGVAGAIRPVPLPQAPILTTRDEMYDLFHARLLDAPRRLGALERSAMAQAAVAVAIAAPPDDEPEGEAAGAAPRVPFRPRPGLVAEMFRFYDELRRQSRQLERFQELIEETLGGAAIGDRGTDRTLAQTRLLAGAFREYERRVLASGGCDEHSLRDRLVREPVSPPVTDVVITVADWIAEPDGLFVSDFDLLARMPGVERVDLVCTEQILGSGFHERLHGWWPGIEEVDAAAIVGQEPSTRPVLEIPAGASDRLWFTVRDRQEELVAVAQHVKAERRQRDRAAVPLDRTAVVFKRPLPYLYLADVTLGAAGIPYQVYDALPLASVPLVAVVDLVLDAAETRFAREPLVALLRAPQLSRGHEIVRESIQALDFTLRLSGYIGELARLEAVAERSSGTDAAGARPAFVEALDWARSLSPLLEPAPASTHLRRLCAVLAERLTAAPADSPWHAHESLARDVVLRLLAALADAHDAHHDPVWTIVETAAAVRRAIEGETFGEPRPGSGLQLLDDRAARYGDFDDMTIVGLTDADWPERRPRNVFYPSGLLKALGWPSEHTRRHAADARFLDLLGSATRRVAVSTIALDDEAIVMPSLTLDEISRARLATVPVTTPVARLTAHDALSTDPVSVEALDGDARDWAELRLSRTARADPLYHGFAGGGAERPWSVSALEVYLACPFKFFAQHVLRLEEEVEDSDVMDPRQQGQFVHRVFEEFFAAWRQAGHGTITPALLDRARALFTEVVDRALVDLPEAEAGLERTRLLGSSAAAGLGEVVMRMEAERPLAVVERLLEHRFDGPVTVPTAAGPRAIHLRGKADRIDLLEDGTFRLIDYKLGWPPARSRALQLPAYAMAAEQQLNHQGRSWAVGEAAYVAFKGPRRIVPVLAAGADRDRVLLDAGQRLADVVDAIGRGEFPPTPDDVYLCEQCGYAAVCRKDYVGDV
jgi:RecB family exonuclease